MLNNEEPIVAILPLKVIGNTKLYVQNELTTSWLDDNQNKELLSVIKPSCSS